MKKIKFSLAGWLCRLLFPPRCLSCGALLEQDGLCQRCAAGLSLVEEDACRFCGRGRDRCRCDYGKALLFEQAVNAYYYEGTGRVLLQKFKFHGNTACYDQVLAQRFLARTAQAYAGVPFDYIVPVPRHAKDHRFDQARYLAQSLSKQLGVRCRTDLLEKVRKTLPQHRQNRENRAKNIKGAFAACKKQELQGVCILLVDDVSTSFSTLNECAMALKNAGADRVLCACLMTAAGKNKKDQGDRHE